MFGLSAKLSFIDAGIQLLALSHYALSHQKTLVWIPASAGMTEKGRNYGTLVSSLTVRAKPVPLSVSHAVTFRSRKAAFVEARASLRSRAEGLLAAAIFAAS